MTEFFINAFMALIKFVNRASRERLGTLLHSQTILLSHTDGRRSARHYATEADLAAAWVPTVINQPHVLNLS